MAASKLLAMTVLSKEYDTYSIAHDDKMWV